MIDFLNTIVFNKEFMVISFFLLFILIPKRFFFLFICILLLISTYYKIELSKYILIYKNEFIFYSILFLFIFVILEINLFLKKSQLSILNLKSIDNKKQFEKQSMLLENEISDLKLKIPKEFSKDDLDGMKKAGDDYERKVGEYYESLGYKVVYRGLTLGYKDAGIDLIAAIESELILIQCKYWKKPNSINHRMIKEFYGSCNFYIDKFKLHNDNIKCIYVIPNIKSLNFQAYELFKENYERCRFKVLE